MVVYPWKMSLEETRFEMKWLSTGFVPTPARPKFTDSDRPGERGLRGTVRQLAEARGAGGQGISAFGGGRRGGGESSDPAVECAAELGAAKRSDASG